MHRTKNNLQKICLLLFVTNNIIPASPNRPTYCRNTDSNMSLINFSNPIQPITKHISNIRWWWNIVGKIYHAPNNFGKRTVKKQMINCFIVVTETTFLTPCLFSLHQIILSKQNFITKKPHKDLDFERNFDLPKIFP
jgi:hypothetical protein